MSVTKSFVHTAVFSDQIRVYTALKPFNKSEEEENTDEARK